MHLVDTPGFGDTYRPDDEVFSELGYMLTKAHQTGIQLSGVLYMHPISDFRMQGSAMRSLKLLKALCGQDAYSSIVLTATHCGKVSNQKRRERMFELRSKPYFWQDICRDGAITVEFGDNTESALGILDLIISMEKRHVLQFQRQMVDKAMQLHETDAGKELQSTMLVGLQALKAELAGLRAELQLALRKGQEHDAEQIQHDLEELNRRIDEQNQTQQRLNTTADSLTMEWDGRMLREHCNLDERLEVLDESIARLRALGGKANEKSNESALEDDDTVRMLKVAEQERTEILIVQEHQLSKKALLVAKKSHTAGWVSAVASSAGVAVAIAAAVAPAMCVVM